MSRSRIVFLVIIASAIGLVVIAQVMQRLPAAPIPTPVPKQQIEVAVNPLAFEWVKSQADAYNRTNPNAGGQPFEIRVTQRDGIDVWQGNAWSPVNHPVGWIPEATFAVDYAKQANAQFDIVTKSVASTPLVWGIFVDRGKLVTAPVDWTTLYPVVQKSSWKDLGGDENWGAPKLAIPSPSRSTAGYAALLSAAASKAQKPDLTAQNLSDREFQNWLQAFIDAVPNFNSLGLRPAQTLASRGASLADFALLPESDWLVNYSNIKSRGAIRFSYPAYKLNFDMPFAVWSGNDVSAAQRDAAKGFADFLGQATAQKSAASYGLRPALMVLTDADTSLFSAASDVGIVTDPPPGAPIVVPSDRNSALGLLNQFK
jgi:hypothetical protein